MTVATAINIVRNFFSALWTSRVAAASALASPFVFYFLPQARDLLIEIKEDQAATALYWTGFYAILSCLWLLPVYCCSRASLRLRRASFHVHCVPWLLVAVCVAGIVLALRISESHLVDGIDVDLAKAAASLLGTVHWTIAAISVCLFSILTLRFFRSRSDHAKIEQTRADKGPPVWCATIIDFLSRRGKAATLTRGDILCFYAIFSLSGVMIVFAMLDPLWTSSIFPRAYLLPVLMGFWVPPLTLLAMLSHRVKAPLVASLLALGIAMDSLIDVYPVKAIASGQSRPILEEAFSFWKQANGCNPDNEDHSSICPQPIIVATAGGASRATFFTASVLGLVTDITRAHPDEFNDFSKQLFAISGVSGGSLGAAFYLAVREAVLDGNDLKRIRHEAAQDQTWFLSATAPTSPTQGWKDALQILASKDYLTPAVAAGLRDTAITGSLFEDRAAVLVKSWQAQSSSVLGTSKYMERGLTQFAPTLETWRPLLFLNGSVVENGRRVIASQLDPRINPYPTTIDPYPERLDEFYTDAYDLHDLLNGTTTGSQTRLFTVERQIKRDVSLADAVMVSARFPIITPHGIIENAERKTVATVVDGGYFENFGALTAADIVNGLNIVRTAAYASTLPPPSSAEEQGKSPKARALRSPLDDRDETACIEGDRRCVHHRQRLRPLVIQISNDPGTEPCHIDSDNEDDPQKRVGLPKIEKRTFFPSLSSIVYGVLGSRVGRGTHATEYLSYALDEDRVGYFAAYDRANPGYAHMRVCLREVRRPVSQDAANTDHVADRENDAIGRKFRDVSMSWWLSKPVQAFLEKELCNTGNRANLTRILIALSKNPTASTVDYRFDSYRKKYVDATCNAMLSRRRAGPSTSG